MRRTLPSTGLKTKREAVEEGLRAQLRLSRQSEVRRFRGKLKGKGDFDRLEPPRRISGIGTDVIAAIAEAKTDLSSTPAKAPGNTLIDPHAGKRGAEFYEANVGEPERQIN